jgi:hypothetical protein
VGSFSESRPQVLSRWTSHHTIKYTFFISTKEAKMCESIFVVEERKHRSYSDEGVITNYTAFATLSDAEAYKKIMTDDDVYSYVIRPLHVRGAGEAAEPK